MFLSFLFFFAMRKKRKRTQKKKAQTADVLKNTVIG